MPGFSFSDPSVWEAAENLQNDAPLQQTYVPQKKVQPKKPSRKERMSELELFNQLNNFKSAQPKKGKKQDGQSKKQDGQSKKQDGQSKKQDGQSKKQEGQSKKQEGQSKKQEGQSKKQEGQSKKQEGQSKKQDGQSKKQELNSKSKQSESKNADTRPKDSNASQKTVNQKQSQPKMRAPKISAASHYPGLIHLKWADFESHVARLGYKQLRNKTSLQDVTIAVEGQTLKAHKKILSACSPLLKNSLKGADPNSVLNLKNTTYGDLSAILEFMYAGEVYVEERQLASILRTAEKLQVKGMVSPNEE